MTSEIREASYDENGDAWGNGEERRARLSAAGYGYEEIQDLVNIMLK